MTDTTTPPAPTPTHDVDFEKDIDIDLYVNADYNFDVELDKDVHVNVDIYSDVEVYGNYASLEGTVEAVGYDTLSELTFTVTTIEDCLSEVSVVAVSAVD